MKKYLIVLGTILFLIACVTAASAGQVKVFVAEFAVSGAQNKEELQGALPALLSSRLNSDTILIVDQATAADATVTGSYVLLGKVFSLDATFRNNTGKVLVRAFEQGDSQDELIPAIGKLVRKLAAALDKAEAPTPPAQEKPAAIKLAPTTTVAPPEIVKSPILEKSQANGGSQRLEGELRGMALGRTFADGEREVFVAGRSSLRLYRVGQSVKLIDEKPLGKNTKVLSIDSADLDGDGVPEAYLTIISSEALTSQVWVARENSLQKVADRLPYYFRGLAPAGGQVKIYAQQMGLDDDFYGDVYELEKRGDRYEIVRPMKLPRSANIFSFNVFHDANGKNNFVFLNGSGYIIVCSPTGEELWRSTDKFGGSELFFQREDMANIRSSGDKHRWIFLQPKIFVTRDNTILVPKNSGTFTFGNQRSYDKSSVYAFSWNGALLEEKWHTSEMAGYLPDYFVDQQQKELVMLLVVKKAGIFAKGASTVVIKKIE